MFYVEFIQNSTRRFDLFSRNIMFTYKGESQFSTWFGGFVSILILWAVGVYLSILGKSMIYRESSKTSLSTEIIDLSLNSQDYYLADYGFYFGVSITNLKGQATTLDSTYFTLEFTQSTTVKDGNYYSFNRTQLGLKLWSESDLFISNKEYLSRGLNAALYWPSNKNYRIAGNYLSSNYQFISILLKKCSGANC